MDEMFPGSDSISPTCCHETVCFDVNWVDSAHRRPSDVRPDEDLMEHVFVENCSVSGWELFAQHTFPLVLCKCWHVLTVSSVQ